MHIISFYIHIYTYIYMISILIYLSTYLPIYLCLMCLLISSLVQMRISTLAVPRCSGSPRPWRWGIQKGGRRWPGKSLQEMEVFMGKPWEDPGKIMGQSENHGENHGKIWGNSSINRGFPLEMSVSIGTSSRNRGMNGQTVYKWRF